MKKLIKKLLTWLLSWNTWLDLYFEKGGYAIWLNIGTISIVTLRLEAEMHLADSVEGCDKDRWWIQPSIRIAIQLASITITLRAHTKRWYL